MTQKEDERVKYMVAEKEALNYLLKQLITQWQKWGIQRHTYQEWKAILDEELAEFNCKVIAAKETGYEELTHCAAVCVAWIIDIMLSGRKE